MPNANHAMKSNSSLSTAQEITTAQQMSVLENKLLEWLFLRPSEAVTQSDVARNAKSLAPEMPETHLAATVWRVVNLHTKLPRLSRKESLELVKYIK